VVQKKVKKKILYLYSDTGGGHRAAAIALTDAVERLGDKKYTQQMVDVFASTSGFLNIFARLYAPVIKYSPKLWGLLWYWLDDPKKLRTLEKIAYPFVVKKLTKIIKKFKPDVIVSVHPMVNHLAVTAIKKSGKKIPFVVVVMDPVTFHRAWIAPESDLVIVATPEAQKMAVKYGMSKKKVKLIGLPIHPKFYFKEKRKTKRKKKLFTILLMGGGEGAGGMGKIIKEFARKKIDAKVIVISGRNKKLEKNLRKMAKLVSFPLEVYGFTDEVPRIMAESDLIVTKAGPGSIAEALAMDLPLIITSWLPGQEEGNVDYVVREKVGKVSKDPKKIVKLIAEIMKPENYRKIMRNIKRIRRPKAAMDIAKQIFKYLCIACILVSGFTANAEVLFKDVPDGHWAADSVYKLVKMGVTRGFPDGTFRGKRRITRYEVAVMLSKFAVAINRGGGVEEKLLAELGSELALIKYKQDQAAKEVQISGELETRGRLKASSPRQRRADYRLKVSMKKNFSESSSLRIRLDTLDAGFNTNTTREIATRLIDVESRFKLGGIDYRVNLAPGWIVHNEDLDFSPSENNMIYARPRSAITATKKIKKLTVSGAYITHHVQSSGIIGIHEVNAEVAYDFGRLALFVKPRLLYEINGPSDKLVDLSVEYELAKGMETSWLLGWGDLNAGRSGMYVKAEGIWKDAWKTGTNVVLRVDKVGSQYRHNYLDEYEFIDLNNFDRLILDGTVDVGLNLKQNLNKDLAIEWIGDFATTGDYKYGASYPGTYFLWQAGIIYYFSPGITANAYYRVYNVPSGVTQFGQIVSETSDIIGVKVSRAF
jgi:1,2-diacylglycerol 3-beta-galactosyltransferase